MTVFVMPHYLWHRDEAAISVEANLRQQVKPRSGGRNQNRCLMRGKRQ